MYGVFFHDNQEPAFSNYRLWESLGFVLAFAYANFLCIRVKLIILLLVLTISMIGYILAEYINRKQVDQEYSVAMDSVALKETKNNSDWSNKRMFLGGLILLTVLHWPKSTFSN